MPINMLRGVWGNVVLALVSIVLSSLLLDRAMGLLGYPSQPPIRYSHPPNLDEVRRNIEFEHSFVTNSLGLRYKEIPLAKPAGERRIFLVGDSFTEGVGVEPSDRFGERLEGYFQQRGQNVLFVNGGLAGTGPLEYARIFANAGLRYDPDGLLILLNANDVAGMLGIETPADISSEHPADVYPDGQETTWRSAIEYLWPRVVTQIKLKRQARQYMNRTHPDDFVDAVVKEANRVGVPSERIQQWRDSLQPKLVTAANQGTFNGVLLSAALLYPTMWVDALDIDTPQAERKWQSMISIVDAMVGIAKEHGFGAAIVFVPTRFQYDRKSQSEANIWVQMRGVVRERWLTEEVEVERRLRQWAARLGIPFLDLTDEYREAVKTHDDLTWPLDGHWTAEGHRIASLAIDRWLTQQRLFALAAAAAPMQDSK